MQRAFERGILVKKDLCMGLNDFSAFGQLKPAARSDEERRIEFPFPSLNDL